MRRLSAGRIDLITFQFNKYGGSFVGEVATCGPTGVSAWWGQDIGPTKVRAIRRDRARRLRLSCCAAELDPALRVVVAEDVFEADIPLANVYEGVCDLRSPVSYVGAVLRATS
jgi:hypothetical protein